MADDLETMVFGTDFARCPFTNRPYESGIGAASHERQSAMYLQEYEDSLPPEQKAERARVAEELRMIEPKGQA